MKLGSLDTISAIPVCCDPSNCLRLGCPSHPPGTLPVLLCDISPQTPWLTCCTAPGLVSPLLSLLFLSGFHTRHFFLILSSQRLVHGTDDYKGSMEEGSGSVMGASGWVVEVFRERPCVTCALCWFCVCFCVAYEPGTAWC